MADVVATGFGVEKAVEELTCSVEQLLNITTDSIGMILFIRGRDFLV